MISLIHMKALIVKPRVKVKACRDPEDDAVIECAIAAKAKRIVTGDQDLLTMKTYRGISIIGPAPSHQAWAFPDFPHLGAEFTFLRSHLKRRNISKNTGPGTLWSSRLLILQDNTSGTNNFRDVASDFYFLTWRSFPPLGIFMSSVT